MDIVRITTLVAAALLAAAFWASARVVGGALARRLRQPGLPASATTALGLAAYALAGTALGAVGLLYWPLLALLGLLPALLSLPSARSAARRLPEGELGRLLRDHPELLPSLALTVALYAALATLPVFHYDLLTNYAGVAKEYLLAHRTTPLPWNVFSSAFLPLHALIAYPLALNALLGEGPFAFGWGSVLGFFHLFCIAGSVRALWELAGRLVPRQAGYTAALASLLLLTMPQSLLLDAVRNMELVTSFVAMALAAGVVVAPTGAAAALGALAGFLVAAKVQHGVWAAIVLAVIVARARSFKPPLAFAAGGAVLLAPQLLRSWAAFGNPLFPYVGGSAAWRAAADRWLAINAVALPTGLGDLARRLVHLVSLQPETGLTVAVLLLLLLRRVRLGVLWLFIVLPVLAVSLTSGAAYHVLRWVQPALALALLGAAANAAELAAGRRALRWTFAAVPLVSLALAARFTGGLLGGPGLLLLPPAEIVGRQLPSLPSRVDLVALAPERVLYVGEIDAYYGAENGVVPAPPSAAVLERYLAGDTAAEVARRLRSAGFGLLAVNPEPPPAVRSGPGWPWADAARPRGLDALLQRAPLVPVRGPLRVWRVPASLEAPPAQPSSRSRDKGRRGPGATAPGSPPSPP